MLSCLIRPWLTENTAHICKSTWCMSCNLAILPPTFVLLFCTQNFTSRALTSPHYLAFVFWFLQKCSVKNLMIVHVFKAVRKKKKNAHKNLAQCCTGFCCTHTMISPALHFYYFCLWYKHSHWLNWILYFNLLLFLICCWHIGSVYTTWVWLVQWKYWINPLVLWCQENSLKRCQPCNFILGKFLTILSQPFAVAVCSGQHLFIHCSEMLSCVQPLYARALNMVLARNWRLQVYSEGLILAAPVVTI